MKRPRCAAHAAGPLRRTSPTRTTRKSSSASCLRLEASLKLGAAADPEEILCFLHYPPLYASYRCGEIIELLHKYGVKALYFTDICMEKPESMP